MLCKQSSYLFWLVDILFVYVWWRFAFLYAVSPISPAQTLGSSVHGTIDGKFDDGYIVTVDLGSEQLKGVLYHVSSNASKGSSIGEVHLFQTYKRNQDCHYVLYRPKSNRSGYNFFFAENYARLKPSFCRQERVFCRKIGFMWRNLTDPERQV